MNAIHTNYSHTERGYIIDDGPVTVGQVEHQIKEVLRTIRIDDGNALDHMEWISWNNEQGLRFETSDPFPEGRVLVSVDRGGSEGWLIHVRPDWESPYSLIVLKYLSGPDVAFKVARALTEAFWEGCYGAFPKPVNGEGDHGQTA